VVKVEPFAEGDYLTISIRGRNVAENDDLKIGQYHTFVLQLNQKITIIKECWTGYDIGLLRELSQESSGCEVAAIVMDEGIANICYVKNSMTLRKLKIEKNVSKKSSGEEVHNKSLARFFEECYRGIKSINYEKIKCMIVASPGFVNEQFLKYVKEESNNETDKGFKK
jgi:protein pelota